MTDLATPNTRQVAKVLAEIGLLLELNGESSFRARAFTNAARALEGSDADLRKLAEEDRLTTLRGIGSGIAGVIRDFVLTGECELVEELRAATPVGLYDLLRIPGLGPKRIHTLYDKLGIDGLDTLEEAAAAGRVAGLPGFGAKTAAKIVDGVAFARASRKLRRYPEALEIAATIRDGVLALSEIRAVEIVGAVRRRMEIVDRIDLVASAEEPLLALQAFREVYGVGSDDRGTAGEVGEAESLARGEVVLQLSDGVTARLRCVSPEAFVGVTVWETGSEDHVAALVEAASAKGLELGPDGLLDGGKTVALARESELYQRLGLAFVPPEMREGLGEIEHARKNEMPELIEVSDLQGAFHCHTTYSDGKASIEEMGNAARERGWSYLGLADHSRAAAYAGGLTLEEVRAQHEEIDTFHASISSARGPFRVFKGIESDILPDGSLDYPDDVLASFDYVVGSVHSSFGMSRDEMTKRVVRAVQHPALTILGHPTGRLLLTRDGYAIDIPRVLEAAAESGVVIEINANPHRLDLDWRHVRTAAEMGILIAINPDAHSIRELDNIAFGVNMARKAGLEARQVLNTWSLDEVAEYLAKRK